MKKMKKVFLLFLAMTLMLVSLAACGPKDEKPAEKDEEKVEDVKEEKEEKKEEKAEEEEESEDAPFHIGIVTGTVSQAEDEQRGAESMIEKYGDAKDGGYIMHKNYPDNYMAEQETTIQQIVTCADDPLCKAVIVNQGPPGTAAAFKQIKEKNPDILCFVGNSQEDPNLIEGIADLIVDPDNVTRGYLIPLAAQKMGADTFVHVTFPRHMSIELLSLRRDIMEATCDKIGMTYVDETAPDPMSDVGIPGAQNYILEQMPAWVEEYGKDAAFFATNDAHTEPMLLRTAELGAIFVGQDLPSAILGYPGALAIDLKDEAGDWPAILEKVEEAVIEKGGKDRMGTWAFSFGYSTTQMMTELAKQEIEGKADHKKTEDIVRVYEEFTPGCSWGATWFTDYHERNERPNHALVYQDTYVFGKGYLGMTKEEVPDIYEMLDEFKENKK